MLVDAATVTARLTSLHDACRAIAGAETLDALLQVVTEAARGLIGTHQAVTSRLVEGWEAATTCVSLSDKYAAYRDYEQVPKGLGVLNYVTRENQPLRLTAEELPRHPEWRGLRDAPGHPPLPDYLAAPLVSRHGRNIGLIQLADKVDGSKFTEDDEVLLVQLAQLASATLEHVELLERERASREDLERASRHARLAAAVGIAFTSRASVAAKLQQTARALVDNLDVAFARIWTLALGEDVLVLRASAGQYTHLDGPHARVPVGAFKIGLIAAERRPHLTNDVPHDPRISDPEWAKREGMQSFAGYPLIVGGRCIGVMGMFARRALPESTLAALGTVADAVAVGVEQARDAERLRTRASQLRRLAEVASTVNTAATVDDVLAILNAEARDIVGAHQAVTSMTRGRDWAQAITTVSLSDKYSRWRGYDEPPDGSGIYAWVCETQQAVRMTQSELEAHPRWRGFGAAAEHHPPMRGWLAAPLTAADGSNLGLIQLSDKYEGEFTEEDEAILVQLAEIASAAVVKAKLYQDLTRVAHALQRSLLPPAIPPVPGLDVAAEYRAGTEEVGGDFYDVFPLRESLWGLMIGDVQGKGPEAAALTALARHSIRTAAMLQHRPHDVLQVLNRALLDPDHPERFCSAVFATLALQGSTVTVHVAGGGHPPLLVLRANGETELLPPTGPLLGLFDDIAVSEVAVELHGGDALVAWTDGVTEARCGGEQFGDERVVAITRAHSHEGSAAVAHRLVAASAAFATGEDQDDAAVVVLRVVLDAAAS